MKNLKITITLAILLLGNLNGFAQYFSTTQYYDSQLGLAHSNEIAEDGVIDNSNNLYVAGEIDNGGSTQGIHITKYSGSTGLAVKNISKSSSVYKLSVIKTFWGKNNQLYVVCSAAHTLAWASTLTILRYNSSLTLLGEETYGTFFTPTNAAIDTSSNHNDIYVSGQLRTGSSGPISIGIIKVNSALVMQYTPYSFYYSNSTDSIAEESRDIFFDYWDHCVYVVGKAFNPVNNKSGEMAIKLTSSLSLAHIDWKKKMPMDTNNNTYNSIANNNGKIFIAGMHGFSNAWRLTEFDALQGYWINTVDYTSAGFENEALKITAASSWGIYVVGTKKSQSLNQTRVIVRKYNTYNLSSAFNYFSETFAYNTKVYDAISIKNPGNTSYRTFITGTKYAGGMNSDYHMFFRAVDSTSLGGPVFITDDMANHNAAGRRIIKRSGSWKLVSVIGHKDVATLNAQPHDYKWFVRSWEENVQRLSDINESEKTEISVKIFPNPSSDLLNIESSDALKTLTLFDLQGKTVLQNQIADVTFTQKVTISHLPKGIYFLRVNEGKVQKIIKN